MINDKTAVDMKQNAKQVKFTIYDRKWTNNTELSQQIFFSKI